MLHIEGVTDDDVSIPKPSSLEKISRSKKFNKAIPVLIDIQISSYRKRINITIDEKLLNRIDQIAVACHLCLQR